MEYTAKNWTLGQRILFRFFGSFFLIYILGGFIAGLFKIIVPWFGSYILQLKRTITIFTNGSGDTTYDYVTMLLYVSLALMITFIWSIIDRRERSYDRFYYWIGVLVRYFLALNMFVYGFYKVFHLQMSYPNLSQLIQPLGDKSPMGLAWAYVGFSKGFSFFTGAAEIVAGFFLLFRKSAVLGAILTAIVTLNIVAINLFFDVPVKLFSITLFLMSVFLLAGDFKRLLDFFVLNRFTAAKPHIVYFKSKWMEISRIVLKSLFIGYLFYNGIMLIGIRGMEAYGDQRKKPALYGLYDAELMIKNGDTIPPLITDTGRWRNLVIEWDRNATLKMMNDSLKYYSFTTDTLNKAIDLYPYTDSTYKGRLTYETDNNYLILRGHIKGDSLLIRLKRRELNTFRLMNRGFRWINEYPYNR
ncbi:hypothetical protein H8S90_01960 [Olivibacter sp. SDN3]|uniref:DoxX family protein n=1 Tax=Olivibacter sp. SDN3 TaxID=2764720 RepID=UPI0016510BEC|nr:DoxX family protein [Olivibacter sp. SDN3]QNL50411.1 hypothetical protein H8S90_01960 [Olivibacter sp. SDN3]